MSADIENGLLLNSGTTLRCGDWRDVLVDVDEVDVLIFDAPYGARTHAGQRHGRRDARYGPSDGTELLSHRGLGYEAWTKEHVDEFVTHWGPKCKGWFVGMTSHDLYPHYRDALEAIGRYVFAPIAAVQRAMNVRLAGDGPSNWTCWIVVSRRRDVESARWGALPGAYVGKSHDQGENALDRSKRAVAGGKPLWLMNALVRDYSKPGDLVCDPFAGGGTTAIACESLGRRFIGSEIDSETHASAVKRIAAGVQIDLFGGA